LNLRPSGYEPDDRIEIDGDSNISGVPLEQLKRSSRRTMNQAEFVINPVTRSLPVLNGEHGRFAVFVSGKHFSFRKSIAACYLYIIQRQGREQLSSIIR
jgi:hypothetical protein